MTIQRKALAREITSDVLVGLTDRFWKLAIPREGDACWEWRGCFDYKGYAIIGSWRANRISYAIHYDFPPADMMVCHRCDNPGCVNPSHLNLGTNQENMTDMVCKNRQRKGGPITSESAFKNELAIMELRLQGVSPIDICKKLKIGMLRVRQIMNNSPPSIGGRLCKSAILRKGAK